MNNNHNFPTLRDYWYGVAIVVLILTFILAHWFGKSPSLASDLSVAATLISIILGVLAIFISLYQSLSDQKASDNLHLSSNRIVVATEKLDQVTTIISNLSSELKTLDFTKHFSELKQETSALREMLTSGGRERIEDKTSSESLSEDFVADFLRRLNSSQNNRLIKTLYLIQKLVEVNLDEPKTGLDRVSDFVITHLMKDSKNPSLWLAEILGQLRALRALGLVSFSPTLSVSSKIKTILETKYDSALFTDVDKYIDEMSS
jgi:hypothetical protein